MDAEPRTDVLIRALLCIGACTLVAACPGGDLPAPPPLPALAGPVSVLRLPVAGGAAEAYSPDSLTPVGWTIAGSLPALSAAIGVDLDQRLVFGADTDGALFGLDLEGRSVRPYLGRATLHTVGPDGAVYAVTPERRVAQLSRRVAVTFPARLAGRPVLLAGTLANQVVVVMEREDAPPVVQVISQDRASDPMPLPRGATAATAWGDLLAVAADTAVVLVDPTGRASSRSISVSGSARSVAFSPSGHRLYVATDRAGLAVLDRYSLRALDPIRLPGAVRTLRPDATGRWMLARPVSGDSVWVIDLPSGLRTATVRSDWQEDLPLVTGVGTLLVRDGADVAAYDLTRSPPRVAGRIGGGAVDLWLALRWVPPDRQPVALAAAETALVVQDSALLTAAAPPQGEEPTQEIFLQVSTSQNPDWARELARQIRDTGFPASVSPPATPEEGYRVVVGPYASRELAEEAGRRLGRPFFLLNRPPPRP